MKTSTILASNTKRKIERFLFVLFPTFASNYFIPPFSTFCPSPSLSCFLPDLIPGQPQCLSGAQAGTTHVRLFKRGTSALPLPLQESPSHQALLCTPHTVQLGFVFKCLSPPHICHSNIRYTTFCCSSLT